MKLRSWRPWFFGGLAFLLLACVGLFIWGVSQFGWDWTGFNGGYHKIIIHGASQDQELPQAKTLWDWFQLLIVPAILAAGAAFFTWLNTHTERQIAQQRYEQEQKIADQRYKQDQELALEKQREDLLQAYLDRMAELLLEKGLRDSEGDDEVRKVARTRTVSTLIQLDGKRARTIFVFLKEAQLTEDDNPTLVLEDADLSNAKWSEANLNGFNLRGATLVGADLNMADLSGADLSMADLSGADLNKCNLFLAYLFEANFFVASLQGADLRMARLSGADRGGADLRSTGLSGADLRMATLSGADLSGTDLSGADLHMVDLSNTKFVGADLSDARYLEPVQFNKTILREVKGLTPEQLAHCKASGAIVDGGTNDMVPPSQQSAATSSQETSPQSSLTEGQAAPSTTAQEATPEATLSQKDTSNKNGSISPASLSLDHTTPQFSSQERAPVAPLIQQNNVPPSSSPSQDTAS
ncbi:pentapeptide repeat-containing protein [Ktedonospora formicarum]|uniref:Pentapeptide repeat-containing protein n=1 Tax=Ktedonospora formicarum TaxID=2778364 RepID=A0A8J3HXN6_9CHLR|nr:pentapeptide repeat-containing protein [Ktedonospora formicarum]GHO41884.1 hypothetical protein KSX_00470 [Ktedonospora formicarum]